LRIIEDQDLSSVFGIELDSTAGFGKKINVKVANKAEAQKKVKAAVKTGRNHVKKTSHKAGNLQKKKAARKTIKKTKNGATKTTAKGKATKKPTQKPAKKNT
jgi:capsule polysaccharide export protein KpsE/RkpR